PRKLEVLQLLCPSYWVSNVAGAPLRQIGEGERGSDVGDGEDVVEGCAEEEVGPPVAVQVTRKDDRAAQPVGGASGGRNEEPAVAAGKYLDQAGARAPVHVGARIGGDEVEVAVSVEVAAGGDHGAEGVAARGAVDPEKDVPLGGRDDEHRAGPLLL